MSGKLTIDDDDIQSLAREAFGDERSGNPAADDQRIAFDVLSEIKTDSMPPCRKPGRAAAAQVGLFGIVCVKNADNKPLAAAGGLATTRRPIVLTGTMRSGSKTRFSPAPANLCDKLSLMERNRDTRDWR